MSLLGQISQPSFISANCLLSTHCGRCGPDGGLRSGPSALGKANAGPERLRWAQSGPPKPFDFPRKRSIVVYVNRGRVDLPLP